MPDSSWNPRNVRFLGIVSDTHGHVENTKKAVRLLEQLEVEVVLHCGDIGSVEIPPLFAARPTHYVFGNVDWDQRKLRESITRSGQTCHGRFGKVALGKRKIAWLHGDDAGLFQETVESGDWDLVCYGHTHEAEQHRENGTLVVNPGAIYRAWPLTVAVVELANMDVSIVRID